MVAIENAEQIMGGLDAQYGNAQSGVINYKTKEGGDSFEGELYYITDDYGQPDNTYDNLDRVFAGARRAQPDQEPDLLRLRRRGPSRTPIPTTTERRNRHAGPQLHLGGRPQEQQRPPAGQAGLQARPDLQADGRGDQQASRGTTPTIHIWSRDGYVQTFVDTTQTGEVVLSARALVADARSTRPMSTTTRPSTRRTTTDQFNQLKLVWTHTLDAATFYSVKLNRSYFYRDTRVQGKEPWEYDGTSARDFYFNYIDNESSDFFVICGDYPDATRTARPRSTPARST